jgi:RNA polymerase sigma-70 factor (ECF subfamily)
MGTGSPPVVLRIVPLGTSHDDDSPGQPTLEGFFHAYAPYVARIALRLLGRNDEVDDIVQEVFLAAWRGVDELREPEAVKGWLATITVRRVGRRLRMRRLRSFVGLDDGANYAALAVTAGQERAALLAQIYGALDRMPTELRVPWVLQKIEGEGLDRVALLCGCSLATAKRRISAAQTRLEGLVGDA